MVFLVLSCVYAEESITVKINDVTINFDVAPQTVNGRTMVPVRAIFEALDAKVSWNEATSGITAVKGDTKIVMHLNDTKMTVNNTAVVLDTAPFETGGRTLVPVRAISEAFDCKVLWEEATQTVYIQTNVYNAADIAEIASPAVFYIETYDENEEIIGTASGFFISDTGRAVTNYHVVDGASYLLLEMTDGTVLALNKILYADKEADFVVFTVIGASGKLPYLKLGDSDKITVGQKIYTLGSPKGYDNTISDGIISNTNRNIGNNSYIQITAPISHGSSGGALLNESGEVIGVTQGGNPDGENIGWAVPINLIKNSVYYNEPLTLSQLPRDYLVLTPSEQFLTVSPGETVKITCTVEANTDQWYPVIENAYPSIADIQLGEWIDENTFTVNITGKKHGSGGGFVYTEGVFDYFTFSVDVRASHINTYGNSNVATYTHVTGRDCMASYNLELNNQIKGFNPTYDYFYYEYSTDEFNLYCDYLESAGYEREDMTINGKSREYYYSGIKNIIQIVVYPEDNLMSIFVYN